MTRADDRMVRAGRRAAVLALLALPGLIAGCAGPRGGSRSTARRRSGAGPIDPPLTGDAAGTEVVIRAMALIGVPYQWGGDEPADGFDCSGLVMHVYREATGIRLPRTSRLISERGRRVGRRQLREADLVFFHTSRRPWSHVGIYVGDDRFVHAPSTGSLVRVDSINQRYWLDRFDGARRLLG